MAKKKAVAKAASLADILGGGPKSQPDPEQRGCMVCGKEIPAARIRVLKDMKTPLHKWAHTHCSKTGKVKGIYLGEVGTSQMLVCDKVYDDSVRNVFRKAEVEQEDDTED